MSDSPRVRAGRIALAVGVVAGVALAVSGLVEERTDDEAVPLGAIAVVDGHPIARADYERALGALAADHRGPIGAREREAVLERLIDEELLVQEALARGIGERDPRVRTDLGLAMLALLRAAAEDQGSPTEAELRAFYDQHPNQFRSADRYRARQVYFQLRGDDEGARARAVSARAALVAGEVAEGDAPPIALSAEARSVPEIERTFGPSFARAVATTRPGTWSDPVRTSLGYHLVRVDEITPGAPEPFDTVRALVESEAKRARSEAALQDFLTDRRANAEIERAPLDG